MASPRKYKSHSAIRKHWASHLWEKKGFDSKDEFLLEPNVCFACGLDWGGVEAAHIVPRCYGGSDDLDNLHLLCRTCHKNSEACPLIKTRKDYFDWFYARNGADCVLSAYASKGLSGTALAGSSHVLCFSSFGQPWITKMR